MSLSVSLTHQRILIWLTLILPRSEALESDLAALLLHHKSMVQLNVNRTHPTHRQLTFAFL